MVWLVVPWMLTFRSLYKHFVQGLSEKLGLQGKLQLPLQEKADDEERGQDFTNSKGGGSQECVLSISSAVAASS